MSGTLSLQIIKAELVRDIEVMGKMDPYCKLKIGQNTNQTSVAKNQGKLPQWLESYSFKINDQDQLIQIEIWDKNSFSDSQICYLIYKIKIVFQGQAAAAIKRIQQPQEEIIQLTYKGKESGKIYIKQQFFPDQIAQSQQQQQLQYPQLYPQLQPQQYPQYPQQQYPQQQYPQQQYPQQQYPQQQYPQQQYPQQQYPQQQYPQQQYPPQQPQQPQQFTAQQIEGPIGQIFKEFDVNHDGTLERREFYNAVCRLYKMMNCSPPSQQHVDFYLEAFDCNKDVNIDFTEFRRLTRAICGFQ